MEHRISIVIDGLLPNHRAILHNLRAILCDNRVPACFLPTQAHLLDQFLVLGGPDAAERNVHHETAGKRQEPAEITELRRLG